PPLDRTDYLDHAIVLTERERLLPARPTLDELRIYLGGAPFSNWAENAQRFAVMDVLTPSDHKAYIRALLYPARLVYKLDHGPEGIEGRGGGIHMPASTARTGYRPPDPCAGISPGSGRSRCAVSRTRRAAGSGQILHPIPD